MGNVSGNSTLFFFRPNVCLNWENEGPISQISVYLSLNEVNPSEIWRYDVCLNGFICYLCLAEQLIGNFVNCLSVVTLFGCDSLMVVTLYYKCFHRQYSCPLNTLVMVKLKCGLKMIFFYCEKTWFCKLQSYDIWIRLKKNKEMAHDLLTTNYKSSANSGTYGGLNKEGDQRIWG